MRCGCERKRSARELKPRHNARILVEPLVHDLSMSFLGQLYGRAPALLTDLYQLTMAYAHWHYGSGEREAVFHLFFREAPFNNGFAIACGIETAVEYVTRLSFSDADIDYLSTLKDNAGDALFEADFLAYLRDLRFTGDIDAVPEGTAVFAHQPMLRVRAPIIQAQLLESALLNIMNFPTLVATKAARIAHAAGDDPVLDFGLRKAQGIDGGVSAARAAYIGGCAGTSNVLAGQLFARRYSTEQGSSRDHQERSLWSRDPLERRRCPSALPWPATCPDCHPKNRLLRCDGSPWSAAADTFGSGGLCESFFTAVVLLLLVRDA